CRLRDSFATPHDGQRRQSSDRPACESLAGRHCGPAGRYSPRDPCCSSQVFAVPLQQWPTTKELRSEGELSYEHSFSFRLRAIALALRAHLKGGASACASRDHVFLTVCGHHNIKRFRAIDDCSTFLVNGKTSLRDPNSTR